MPGTIERALELARSGQARTLGDLRTRLEREGYDQVGFHLSGAFTKRQLMGLIEAAPRR
jgi:hypothetical protein